MTARLAVRLAERGYARLRGVPLEASNQTLLTVARELGEISVRALSGRAALREAGGVQRVEALAKPPLDQHGLVLRSASAGPFALHSDEAFCAQPCRYVLLHCWRADPVGGGATLLASREGIERAADAPTLDALSRQCWPWLFGDAPVLSATLLRYNRIEVEQQASVSGPAAPEPWRAGFESEIEHTANRETATQALNAAAKSHWLDAFDELFANCAESLMLESGDLLVIDNHRVLHGRTDFAAASPRLLKRVRVL